MSSSPQGWRSYLADFHEKRSGITEDLLSAAVDELGCTPYDWIAEAVPDGSRVLDLACGSAPTGDLLRCTRYVGVDLSLGELRRAAARGVPVAQADASALPVADAAVDAVVCSMSLQLLPLASTLAEVRRVLRPGGTFVATVPAARPMPLRDALRWGHLLIALRQVDLSYPNDDLLSSAGSALSAAGLTLVSDDAAGFGLQVASETVADCVLDALYLPDVPPARVAAARRVVHRWVGQRTTVPVRRLVASG